MTSSINISLAIDLGTSSLAGRLISHDGNLLAEASTPNPQSRLGADILTRLQAAHEGSSRELKTLLMDGLQGLVSRIASDAGCSFDDLDEVVVAGNSGMSCLLLGLPVEKLLLPPFKPPYKELLTVPVTDLDMGLSVPLQVLPPVSGYVGGDLVACLLNFDEPCTGTMLIDVGTNAEISLWDGTRWWVTSAAAGPAFEGGNISSGMTMQAGVACNVSLVDDRLQLEVNGGGAPTGICGSGLAALLAAALEGGLINKSGRILSPEEVETNLGRYLVKNDNDWAIRYHHSATLELLLTQEDVRNFQLAKGAVRAGVQLLLEHSELKPDDVYEIILTGALGETLPVEVLKRVALLPEGMLDRTSFIKNGVLTGLQKYLQKADGQQELEALLQKAQPFPLSGTPAFEKLFLSSLEF